MKDIEPITQKTYGKKHFLSKLIEQGEGTQLDFKFEISDASKIARSLVAFANTLGGKLLVGVKDNGSISGIRSDEEFYMVQAAAEMYSKPKIKFDAKSWKINGKIVLEIDIPKSKNIPHLALDDQKKWKAWIRVNDQNILADDVMHEIWHLSKQKNGIFLSFQKSEKDLLHFLDKNDTITLNNFCKIAFIGEHDAVKILGRLIVLKIIGYNITESGTLYSLNKNFDLDNYDRRL